MDILWQDVKFGARMLVKDRGVTLIAVITLALGIGANTALFSVVKAVLLSALPYGNAERMAFVAQADPGTPRPETVDFTTTSDWRQRNHSFERLSLYRDWSVTFVGDASPEFLVGLRVSWDYFDTLGVKMNLGRTFLKEEDQPERSRVLVLSHGLWLRRFGGDATVIGRGVQLNGATYTVVGVLPKNFKPLQTDSAGPAPEIYSPLAYALALPQACRGCQHLHLVGELKPGVTTAAAKADLDGILRGLIGDYPKDYDRQAVSAVKPFKEHLVGGVGKALWVLLGAVGFVLLIACSNVANLLLARATAREREIALRAALGAERRRLVRQLLTESVLLAIAGGAAGILLGMWSVSLLAAIGPKGIPRLDEVAINPPVLAFTFAATLLTALLFGLAPALRASRVNLSETLKDAARSTDTGARVSLRSALVMSELALAFLLVVGVALLSKSLVRLLSVDPGFDSRHVLTTSSYLWGQRYQKVEAELNFYREVLEKMRALPGAESAAMVSTTPFSGFDRCGFHIRHRPAANPSEAPSVDRYSVTPEYFRVMRIPLKRGRLFTDADAAGQQLVALVSESGARTLFPNEDPVGKQIQLGGRDDKRPWMTIVGVVGNVQQYSLDSDLTAQAYQPQAQDTGFGYTYLVRTSASAAQFESAVRGVFRSVDKTQPLLPVVPLQDYVAGSLAQRKFTLQLLGVFGALGLLMAGVGTYGVISYAVGARTREVGIRVALGAQTGQILRMVLRAGAALAAVGLAIGYVASLVLTRFLEGLLFEVKPTDFASAAFVAALLMIVALAASYVPARRASRITPMEALRYE